MRRPIRTGPTVRPVRFTDETTSRARPVILDSAAMQVGGPIWVRLTDREDSWRQGVITEIAFAVVHVRLLD